jgi:hypothetical protein
VLFINDGRLGDSNLTGHFQIGIFGGACSDKYARLPKAISGYAFF